MKTLFLCFLIFLTGCSGGYARRTASGAPSDRELARRAEERLIGGGETSRFFRNAARQLEGRPSLEQEALELRQQTERMRLENERLRLENERLRNR